MTTTTKDNVATAYATMISLERIAKANGLKSVASIGPEGDGQLFFMICNLECPDCGHFLSGIDTTDQEDFAFKADAFGAGWTAFIQDQASERDQKIAALKAELEKLEGGL